MRLFFFLYCRSDKNTLRILGAGEKQSHSCICVQFLRALCRFQTTADLIISIWKGRDSAMAGVFDSQPLVLSLNVRSTPIGVLEQADEPSLINDVFIGRFG